MHGLEGEGLGLLALRVEEVAEVAQPSLAFDGAVQGVLHRAVGGLVERQLHAEAFSGLQVNDGEGVRDGDYHAVAVDVADGGGVAEILDADGAGIYTELAVRGSGCRKELDGASELEVMLDVGVGRAYDFNGQLVQRIVVAAAEADGPPGITAMDPPLDTQLLGELAESLLFIVVLQLQQELLLLEYLYGGCCHYIALFVI